MSQTTPPTIAAAPAVPIRGTSTFKAAVDAFLTWMAASVAQFQELATNCYNNAVDAYNNAVAAAASAVAAATSAVSAAASATAAAGSSAAPLWVSGATVAQYSTVLSPLDSLKAYRRITATGSGVTDPRNDTTNYVPAVPAALTLLATLTPIAAANVDFLSVFSATYDNYLIIVDGITPASDAALRLRFAVAGTVDTGSQYVATPVGSSGSSALGYFEIIGGIGAANSGGTFSLCVSNANSTSKLKSTTADGCVEQTTVGNFTAIGVRNSYMAANAISGFRLYWGSGVNFAAAGKVRVYGYQNS